MMKPLALSKTLSVRFFSLMTRDLVFSISLILAVISSFVILPKAEYLDLKVLVCLFNLMIVVKAFEELCLLDKAALSIINQCTNSRMLSLVMIVLSFFASMLITNDVALLTLVPLTLIISRKTKINVIPTIVFQTLAANIGSSLTPMGNPQNLYIVSYYKLTAAQFFPPVILFSALGLIWLCLINLVNPKYEISVSLPTAAIMHKTQALIWAVLFILILFSIFGLVNYLTICLITITTALVLKRELILKIDYPLLITFVCFFIFVGNISNLPLINDLMETYLTSSPAVYFSSILLSQIISNVPCAIFLSKFTDSWRELLVGVNVGGMGTIIASLASVISYKLYLSEYPENSKRYLAIFSAYNFLSLIIFAAINYFLMAS